MASGRTLAVKHLIRNAEPGAEAVAAVRRLVHAVAEWQPGSWLDITFGSHDGRRNLTFAQGGSDQPGWRGDVEWATREIAELIDTNETDVESNTPDWHSVLEILPERELTPVVTETRSVDVMDDLDALRERTRDKSMYGQASERTRTWTPWPTARHDDLNDIAHLLAEHHDLLIRFRLAPASEVERQITGDRLVHSWTGDNAALHAYLGRPARLRALVASCDGVVPARLRALARRWAAALTVSPLEPSAAREAWQGGVDSLIGSVVPEGVAISILRLPSAGHGPYPGMATEHPPTRNRPLDPVPAIPERPLRIGSAQTVTGDVIDATLSADDLTRHSFIEGSSGSGKSTLIASLVRELIANGYGCTLLDPHGTTIDLILSELPEMSENTYVVRHEDNEHPVPLDIITGNHDEIERVIDTFIEMVQMMYDPSNTGIVGPRWRRWFGLLADAAYQALGERASLVAITEIGGDVARVKKLAESVEAKDPTLAKSLIDEIVSNRSSEAADIMAWSVSKLHPLVSTAQMRATLGTGYDAVDVREFMDDGKSLLVDLASPRLGVPASRMLGALWLLKHWTAMGERQATDRPHVLIVDEAHLFQYGALPNLLAEGRKFGVGVIVSTQFLGQLREELGESLETNAGSLFTLATGLPYAFRSSTRLGGWPVEQLVRLPKLTAAASLAIDGTRTEPFTLHIDHHDRMDEAGARGDHAARRADEVRARSQRELWEPFRHIAPVTAAELDETLAAEATRAKQEKFVAQREAPSKVPSDSDAASVSNFLDEWLRKRSDAASANTPSAPED